MKLLGYLWASPNTLLGLVVAVLFRGKIRWNGEVFEGTGGGVAKLLASKIFRANAVALGHTLLARSPEVLQPIRSHEMRHVRQAEILGPFYLPLYGVASLLALLQGKHYYRDNWFEIDARKAEV